MGQRPWFQHVKRILEIQIRLLLGTRRASTNQRLQKQPVTRRRSDAGQIIIIVILTLPVIFAMIGLAIDVGYLRYVKRLMQSAADSAAMAGMLAFNYGDYVAVAQNAAALNGFTNGVNNAVVTVNTPPLYGPHATFTPYLEVIIVQNRSTLFAGIFGVKTVTVAARAVAYGGASSQNCIYALNPSSTSFLANGSTNITAYCGIMIDSSNSQALSVNGSPTIYARSIGVVGGYIFNGSPSVTPTPVTSIVTASDPLAYLPKPATTACAETPLSINGN